MSEPEMTGAVDSEPSAPDHHPEAPPVLGDYLRLVAAISCLAAGFLHASVISEHSDGGAAAFLFSVAAIFQIALGALIAIRPPRWALSLAVAANAGFVGFYIVTRTTGVPFIDGMEDPEAFGLLDIVTTGFEFVVVATGLALQSPSLVRRPILSPRLAANSLGVVGLLVAALAVPALTAGHDDSHAHDEVATAAAAHDHGVAPAVPADTDPTDGIDLSGVEGVSPEQQDRAEALLAATLEELPAFADPAVAEAMGYRSIGDAVTGDEHYVKWDLINDDVYLDPSQPESLVYNTRNGGKVLEAAMFILPESYTLDTVPDVGGPLTQWHIHDNLCYSGEGNERRVVGVRFPSDAPCRVGIAGGSAPMIHVWIVPNECGPFAALEGIGAGSVAEGQERSCIPEHSDAIPIDS